MTITQLGKSRAEVVKDLNDDRKRIREQLASGKLTPEDKAALLKEYERLGKKLQKMADEGFLNEEDRAKLAAAVGDPEAWAKLHEEDPELLARLGEAQKQLDGSSPESRDWFGKYVTGPLKDFGQLLAGRFSDDSGFVDESGEFHFRTCFVAGTLVRVHPQTKGAFIKNGVSYKKIEDIVSGDRVLAVDERTGEQSYQPVHQIFVRHVKKIYRIFYENGSLIETTWSHPFYVKRAAEPEMRLTAIVRRNTLRQPEPLRGGQWVEASQLRAGDVSFTAGGKALRIARIVVDARSETVYNFSVAEHHNYFVGEDGVLTGKADTVF